MVKKSSICNFLFGCACAAFNHGKYPIKILDFFNLEILYYSNKRLEPATACVIVGSKNTHGTGIEQINCRFIVAMFDFCNLCARAASHHHERGQKNCIQQP